MRTSPTPVRLGHISLPVAIQLYSLFVQTEDVSSADASNYLSNIVIAIREAVNEFRLYAVNPPSGLCPYHYASSQYGRRTLEISTSSLNEIRRIAADLPYASIALAYLLNFHEPDDPTTLVPLIEWIGRNYSSADYPGKDIRLVRALVAWDHLTQTYQSEYDFELGLKYISSLESLLAKGMMTKVPGQRKRKGNCRSTGDLLVFVGPSCEKNSLHAQTQRYIYQEIMAKNNYLSNVASHLDLIERGKAKEFLELPEGSRYRHRQLLFGDKQRHHAVEMGRELKVRIEQDCTAAMSRQTWNFDRAAMTETYARIAFSYAVLNYSRSGNFDVIQERLLEVRDQYVEAGRLWRKASLLEKEISDVESTRLFRDINDGLLAVADLLNYLTGAYEVMQIRP